MEKPRTVKRVAQALKRDHSSFYIDSNGNITYIGDQDGVSDNSVTLSEFYAFMKDFYMSSEESSDTDPGL